jgi:hypothetical protein
MGHVGDGFAAEVTGDPGFIGPVGFAIGPDESIGKTTSDIRQHRSKWNATIERVAQRAEVGAVGVASRSWARLVRVARHSSGDDGQLPNSDFGTEPPCISVNSAFFST